ncbi:MAG TPA: CHRD domain-containing protein, partial [Nitrosomonas sp.]|nr:CHRD domain-containing protein [Nitrosomonas sp.]
NTSGVPFGTNGTVYKLVPNAVFNTGVLDVPAVDVMLDGDSSDVFRVRLQTVMGSEPIRFELVQAERLTQNARGDNAVFNAQTGKLSIPYINITNADNAVSTFAAELELLADQSVLTFELTQVTLVK